MCLALEAAVDACAGEVATVAHAHGGKVVGVSVREEEEGGYLGRGGARDGGRGGDGAYILWQEKSRLSQESKQLPAKVCGKQQHKAPSLAPSQSSPFGNSRRSTTTVRTLPQPALLFPSLPATSPSLRAAARLP